MHKLHLCQSWILNRSTSNQAIVGVNIGTGVNSWPELAIVADREAIILDHTAWRNLLKQMNAIEDFFTHKSTKLEINLESPMYDTVVSGHVSGRMLLCFSQTVKGKGENYTRSIYIARTTVAQLFKIHELIDHVFDLVHRSNDEICATVLKYCELKKNIKAPTYDESNSSTGLSMQTLMRELVLYDDYFGQE